MTTEERLREWDLRQLVERLDRASDGLGLLLHDEIHAADEMRAAQEEVLAALEVAARYLEQLAAGRERQP
jgi:hypothetical protein